MAEFPQYSSGSGSVETMTLSSTLSSTDQEMASQSGPPASELSTSGIESLESKDGGDSVPIKMVSDEDQKTLFAVLQFLRKNNLAKTVDALEKETISAGVELKSDRGVGNQLSSGEVSSLLSAYSNEADPSSYDDNYRLLQEFIETSLDAYRWELAQLLYPVFVHMYLELIYNNHEAKGKAFFQRFRDGLEEFHEDNLHRLAAVTMKSHMEGNNYVFTLRSNKFVVKMSRDANAMLIRCLGDKNIPIVQNIISSHLSIDVYDGLPRTQIQIRASAGGLCGEAKSDENKIKVYYGLLKEPDIDIPLEDDDELDDSQQTDGGGGSKSKKKKKKEFLSKKNKADPNAPSLTRIPLPEIKDADKLEKIAIAKESLKRIRLGGLDHVAPSVCCYTCTNAFGSVTAVDICDDSSLLAAGFQDSHIRVWSLTPRSLRSVKSASELNMLDKECDDIFERMMDDYTGAESKSLYGHSGAVYAVSISPCRTLLVSSSEDGTVRLWSLLTWTNLMVYKGHMWSVWSVQFAPHGHYFVSCGQDKVARVWVTDHYQPVRIFAGHLSDVDVVAFHPNSNYVATGSSDFSVRVWDVSNGNCVRVYTGHKKVVMCLAWSPDGRYLASAGIDCDIIVWDIATKVMVGLFKGHKAAINTLSFSRDGEVLASGGMDNSVKIWDFHQAIWDIDADDIGMQRGHATISDKNYLLSDFPTKATPLMHLHFTRRNLLLAVGSFSTL